MAEEKKTIDCKVDENGKAVETKGFFRRIADGITGAKEKFVTEHPKISRGIAVGVDIAITAAAGFGFAVAGLMIAASRMEGSVPGNSVVNGDLAGSNLSDEMKNI